MTQRLRVRGCLFLLAVLGLSSRFCSSGRSDERASDATILVCGMDEVFVMDAARPADDERPEKLWSWKGSDSSDLPAGLKRQFATTDECKPVRDGRQILISSSGGGCALVDYASRRVLWSASVPNAHSVELLPQGRIAVASSTASSGRGDRIVVFNENGEGDVVWQGPLQSAHGLVWDDARQRLWALGFDVLESYELADWSSASPSLKRSTSTPLPSPGGHDLQAIPGSNDLILSTHDHVDVFDRETRTFRRHPRLGNRTHVKCVTFHPRTGQLLAVQSTEEQWWTNRIELFDPEGVLSLRNEKIYKARWLPEVPRAAKP